MKISIIGIGRLGGALAIALSKAGFQVENLVARNRKNASEIAESIIPSPQILSTGEFSKIRSDVIFIATQDYEIENVAEQLSENLNYKPIVFHTSGSLSSEILRGLKKDGCAVGSLHPLVSISDSRSGAERFANVFFCVEGGDKAVRIAEEIAEKLGGKSFSISTQYKTLYHAAAVTASGHLTALVSAAIEMLTDCGLNEIDAQKILLPLIKSTVFNLETRTPAESLTGTYARADVQTTENHLEILRRKVSSELLEIYLQLALRSLHLAERQGASRANLEKIREKLLLAKTNLKC
ncbi:MAG: Rossmann-like and DUF2520 domain-containing protein [Pyrinomonadaceae bacterium]